MSSRERINSSVSGAIMATSRTSRKNGAPAPPGSTRLQSSIVRYRIRSCAMPTSKLLIFSDIHNDWKTLEGILSVEADFYISAGDQVTWGRGLDRCGQILKTRGDKVWVLPGNHESASQIAGFCDQYGLNNFH